QYVKAVERFGSLHPRVHIGEKVGQVDAAELVVVGFRIPLRHLRPTEPSTTTLDILNRNRNTQLLSQVGCHQPHRRVRTSAGAERHHDGNGLVRELSCPRNVRSENCCGGYCTCTLQKIPAISVHANPPDSSATLWA